MPHTQMIINYVPGEECRVAVVEDGKLEELHTERFASASRVGNIYLGKVSNVEPSIQAAFVDFGVEENGFLHISDLHPRYFPGEDVEETTERVGHKTPRRERPPIQHCLRRGQEVVVQVLKEGVGTKGPSLTSYLSIPGRFLVMMPQMDRVGVSRKVEDEEVRHKMREILDQLDLPEGFGFILRTAGMDRTKTELKRDLAYLQRLWKDMDKRLSTGSKPRLLYSESDLLVRCLRDVLTAETDEIIIDNETALKRASRFLKIVAPRTTTKLLQAPGKTPIFHAFGIEQQIALINAREVPLPSGGRLVIDQTEALVAIDVNSGKSRDARDAEDNAYRTNIEAVDEICRQLRLRDLGGIVINDLIDMRHASHRKDIEGRFRERLKRDRARSTITPISEFGILEMTRQRMRGSHEQVHFHDCPTCRGRGLVQRPESVASDALRELAAVLDVDRIAKVELVVPPRVAGELLSTKRQLLSRIERNSGKRVDVRVSETLPADRVSFYAYDPQGADIDLSNLPKPRRPRDLKAWEDPDSKKAAAEEGWSITDEEMKAPSEPEPLEEQEEDLHPIEIDDADPLNDDEIESVSASTSAAAGDMNGDGDRRGRRRRRRRGRGGRGGEGGREAQASGRGEGRAEGRGGEGRSDVRNDRRGEGRSEGRGGPRRDERPAPRQHAEPRGDAGGPDAHGEGPDDARDTSSMDLRPHAEGGPAEGDQHGEIGPDGEPRRRRRRRRRRGRGRGGEDAVNGAGPSAGSPDADSANEDGGDPVDRQSTGSSRGGDEDAHADVRPRRARAEQSAPPAASEPAGEDDSRSDEGDGDAGEAEGAGDFSGPDGEGERGDGRRRRRRRRRRGRGGNGAAGGAGAGGAGGAGGNGEPAGEGAREVPTGAGEDRSMERPQRREEVLREPRPVSRDENARGVRENRSEEGGRGGRGEGGGRGGRGGRGGKDRGGRGGDRRGGRGDGRSSGGGGSGGDGVEGSRRSENRSDSRSGADRAPSTPAALPAQPAAPQPKLLYSFRRKLSASELNRRPKPE
ncbi:MAG TPA: Rne/Rng family ribonuclease [Phycisphaerales bacterium]|nr:Rne/Rng family ribonuclease [Phycisphaerales bacterium]